mmetsp:Transcript_83357/g.202189  ORF Transcript_83357/g.202189 Transcript_83357/m.202189 type:complete len:208 (+) Transcript_83357:339-962(+)
MLILDAPEVSPSSPSRSSRSLRECECTLQNHEGCPVTGCRLIAGCLGEKATSRSPSFSFSSQRSSSSMSIFWPTAACAKTLMTPLSGSLSGLSGSGRLRRKSKKGSSALEKRTPLSYSRPSTSGSRSLIILTPSSSRNSPPVSACLKQTKAPSRFVRMYVDSACMPTKNLARDGLLTASYIAFFESTTARAPTLASGSWHGSRSSWA